MVWARATTERQRRGYDNSFASDEIDRAVVRNHAKLAYKQLSTERARAGAPVAPRDAGGRVGCRPSVTSSLIPCAPVTRFVRDFRAQLDGAESLDSDKTT